MSVADADESDNYQDIEFPASSARADSDCFAGTAKLEFLGEVKFPATLGTTYPVGTTKAKMIVTSSEQNGSDYGVALGGGDNGVSFHGREFAKGTWSHNWEAKSAQRSYRGEVRYGKYRVSQSLYPNCNGRVLFRPIRETGGTGLHAGLMRPDWNKNATYCSRVSPGAWARKDEAGRSYSFGLAVKAHDVVGANLGIVRSYSGSQKVKYQIEDSGHAMCGKDSDPGLASKVMEVFVGDIGG